MLLRLFDLKLYEFMRVGIKLYTKDICSSEFKKTNIAFLTYDDHGDIPDQARDTIFL